MKLSPLSTACSALVLGGILSVSAQAQTRVNVAHLAPFAEDIADTAVSVNVNGNEVLTGVTYNQASGYLPLSEAGIAPGTTQLDVFAPPGAATPAISATVDLAADTDYTVIAIGDGTNQPLALLPLVDDNSAPTAGNARIRIVHGAPFAASIDDTAVSIRLDDGTVVNGLASVPFPQNSGFFELPAGTYDLQVATPDGSTTLIDIDPVTLNDGDIVTVVATGEITNQPLGIFALFGDGSSAELGLEPAFTTINPGLNGAWFNPDTNGQGFLIDVLPATGTIFVSWFTWENQQSMGSMATIGNADQRWLTAQGPITGTSASLTISNSSGGLFDDPTDPTLQDAGTLNISFDDCDSGLFEYNLTDSGLQGSIPVVRLAADNLELCEMFSGSNFAR